MGRLVEFMVDLKDLALVHAPSLRNPSCSYLSFLWRCYLAFENDAWI